MEIDQILEILPHRPPILMVDGVEQLSRERIIAFKNVSANEPFFQGHFPGRPVMPGVLIVEAMAQAGALLAHHHGDFDPRRQLIMFMTIDRAKFRAPVRPGDRLVLDVVPLRTGASRWKLKGEARVGQSTVASAEICAVIQDQP